MGRQSDRRRRRRGDLAVSLFPFLSVLACVIGTLTLLLAAIATTVVCSGRCRRPSIRQYAALLIAAACVALGRLGNVPAEEKIDGQPDNLVEYANLRRANLSGAYLEGADLTLADLTKADLRGTVFSSHYVRGILREAIAQVGHVPGFHRPKAGGEFSGPGAGRRLPDRRSPLARRIVGCRHAAAPRSGITERDCGPGTVRAA